MSSVTADERDEWREIARAFYVAASVAANPSDLMIQAIKRYEDAVLTENEIGDL